MSEITWADLSAEEQAALKRISENRVSTDDKSIQALLLLLLPLKLVVMVNDAFTDEYFYKPNDLGREVLAQADTKKPTTITAAEWDTIAEDVKAGHAKVSTIQWGYTVTDIETDYVGAQSRYTVTFIDNSKCHVPANDKFVVTWLPQAPTEPAQPAVGEASKFTDNELLLHAEIARLRGVLRTIADYEDVESDMEEYHQKQGMKQQAENALEIPPPTGGILSTLVSRNETLKAALEAANAEVARLREANTIITRFVNSLVRGAALRKNTWHNIQANEREVLWDSHRCFINYGIEGAVALAQAAAATEAGEDFRNDLSTYDIVHALVSEDRIIDAIKVIRIRYPKITIDSARNYCRAMQNGLAESPRLNSRITELESQLKAAKAAWDASETQWVHMARLLEMPYEETSPWEMVARVASIIAGEIASEAQADALAGALATAQAHVDSMQKFDPEYPDFWGELNDLTNVLKAAAEALQAAVATEAGE